MTNSNNQAKTIAIVSYITIIGWVIALVMHQSNKSSLGRFHLRQMLGLIALALVNNLIIMRVGALYWLGVIISLGLLVLWIIGLISAINEEEKPLPVLGAQFQQWFSFID